MTYDEVLDSAIKELKQSSKPYKMIKEFSFMEGLNYSDDEFQKKRYIVVKSDLFELHTDSAVKFSAKGLMVSNEFNDLKNYKKSLKPTKDYSKYISILIASISLIWNVYQGITNNSLKTDNEKLRKENQLLLSNKQTLLDKNN